MSISFLRIDPVSINYAAGEDWVEPVARIEAHYFVNKGFLREGQLLDKREIDKM
jgi:proline iminopeptidase